MKENGFSLEKARSRRYLAQTIMNADYAEDIALLANTPAGAESLMHSLERAEGGIGLHVNANKTEYKIKRRYRHTKCWFSETSGRIHLPRKLRLIYGKWHKYAISKDMDSYQ